EEVAVAAAGMAARRGARRAAQDQLIAHELAVVFAQGAGERLVAGIADVRAGGPLPNVAEHLVERPALAWGRDRRGMKVAGVGKMPFDRDAGRRSLPLRFGGQAGPGPARERIGF